jgi:UDP-N-acetylglucosamine diphosphorylase/glucosamine-1-phosphate N-acetyltransferase
MNVVIYEANFDKFYPLINYYPQFKLRIGVKTIEENIAGYFKKSKIHYVGRDIFKLKKFKLNEPTVYLSAQSVITQRVKLTKEEVKLSINSQIVGFVKYNPPFPKGIKEINNFLKTIRKKKQLSGFVLNNIWDLVRYNTPLLINHFNIKKNKAKTIKGVNIIGNRKNVYAASDARIHNLVTIDVSDGPVYIDKRAIIRPFTTIIGPSYIGPGSIIDRAKIIKSSIGPVCRIGGEVEACIFQGYANKYHEGFIGHSFIGEWVNLGALTTNSDLKNNYGPVRIMINRKDTDSRMIKLGCFIGDHTKTGIGTLIPTGAVIGSFVNFFGGGMMPRYIPGFKWCTAKKTEDYNLEKAIKTAQYVMKRRGVRFTKYYEELIRANYRCRNLL